MKLNHILLLAILLIGIFFISGCAQYGGQQPQPTAPMQPTPTAENTVSASEFVKNCKQEIKKLEEQVSKTQDFYEKAVLCKMASDKAFACHEKGLTDFAEGPEIPRLGSDEYHETTNFICYCKNVIADKEIEINSERDPTIRFALLKEKLNITFNCHEELSSELYDPSITPRLGGDDLGESSNLEKNCPEIINDLKKQIDSSTGEARTELIQRMEEIEIWCMRAWQSDLFDPVRAPGLGEDPYNTTDYYRIITNDPTVGQEQPENIAKTTDDPVSETKTSVSDPCAGDIQYGYPVYDPENLPSSCKPTDNKPGWDCYPFEESKCTPKLRCFCIAPPEQLSAD